MGAAMEKVSRESGAKPMAMLPFVGNTRNAEYATRLESAGIALLPPPTYAFKILQNLAKFVSYDPAKKDLTLAIPERARKEDRVVFNEFEAKKIVSSYGVKTPREAVAKSKMEAIVLAEDIGYPLVMKIDSKDILHKSDSGCVKLNIKNADQVDETYETIMKNATSAHPEAQIDGILVQKMADMGTEMIIGVNSDPVFGPAIMVGLGGVFVEVFKDTALNLVPVSRDEAADMIDSLKGSKMLKGYRGKPACDIEGLIDAIMAVSRMASEQKNSLRELDINPIFVYEEGVCAVDAVLIADSNLS
jgi:acetyltransferase